MPSLTKHWPTPLLRVPPFPGARAGPLVRPAARQQRLSDEALDQAIAALVGARVGGDYWGRQPHLRTSSYILVRLRDRQARQRLLDALPPDRDLVCWIEADLAAEKSPDSRIFFLTGCCDPWHLIGGASEVYADPDDDLVAIAALCGVPVYRNDGRALHEAAQDHRDMIRARLKGPFTYVNPLSEDEISLPAAIDLCAFWRKLVDSNRPVKTAIGFASWKRSTAEPLLWGGSKLDFPVRPRPAAAGDQLFAWKSRVPPATLAQLEREGAELIEVEDGFIRSVGLGANCVPPLSLVVDRLGAYFDPNAPSELEQLLQEGDFPAEVIHRARRLRHTIVASNISKYDARQQAVGRRHADRRHVLVPGQVEDDRSVQCGGGEVTTNLELLRRARTIAGDAYILYKPHPDVEAGHRIGAVPDDVAARYADEVVRDSPITSLIEMVDEVHVNTSLAGFEALLRHKPVTTHGTPFYAGWGLTTDLGPVPARRTARRTLDELVAAALLLYPRYLDPVTGLPCTPEILIRRLAEGAGAKSNGPLVPLRRLQGQMRRRLASLLPW